MKHTDYITTDKWFAWHPVKTENSGWIWLKIVARTIDERGEVYLGLLLVYYYNKLLSKEKQAQQLINILKENQ